MANKRTEKWQNTRDHITRGRVTAVGRFRKKPVVIEAIQYDGSNWPEIEAFCSNAERTATQDVIQTLEGAMEVSRWDWVIQGVAGEFYPCKPDIFEATYEAVETDDGKK